MTRPAPPILAQWLSRLIRGPDAEPLLGDLEESFQIRIAMAGNTFAVRTRYIFEVAATVLRWWGRFLPTGRAADVPTRRTTVMQGIARELRQLTSGLVRRPSHSLVVILTLALGIGATTTIYSVVDVLLVRPLPYPAADRLAVVGALRPGQEWQKEPGGLQRLDRMSVMNFTDLRQRTHVVERSAVLETGQWMVQDEAGVPEALPIAVVSDGFFDLLAAKPALGTLLPTGTAWAANFEWNAVITWNEWQRRFGGAPDIIGRQVNLGAKFRIIGVLPTDFEVPAGIMAPEVGFFMHLDPTDQRYTSRPRRDVRALVQLKPGITLGAARRDFAEAQAGLARDFPEGNVLPDNSVVGVGVNALTDATIGTAGRPVLIFFGAAMLLLILAATNAANLLLVRGLERESELSVRRALGAGRGRLAAGLLAESVLLALVGGLVGLGVALAGVAAFHRFGPASIPRLSAVAVNPRIMLAGGALALLVGLITGLVPAIRSSRPDFLAVLRTSPGNPGQASAKFRTALTATQLALALMLGIAASLLFRSFVELKAAPLGFSPAHLAAAEVMFKGERPWETWDQLMAAASGVPGVTAAAMASSLPLQQPKWTTRMVPAETPDAVPTGELPGYAVSNGFFDVAGIPLLRGRAFNVADRPESPRVAIVNQTFVREVLPGRDPLGARVRLLATDAAPARDLEVVGVVGDVVQARVEDGIVPAVYVPYTQMEINGPLVLASDRDPAALAPELRRAVAGVLPYGPVREFASLERRVSDSRTGPRFQLLLIGAFGGAAILLSAIGLYGTLAYTVRSRTRELGIRLAIGAGAWDIYRLVLRQGLTVVAVGLLAGFAGTLGVSRLLRGFLFGVSPLDPLGVLGGAAVVTGLVLLAALGPARRAARIDPMSSIRTEG